VPGDRITVVPNGTHVPQEPTTAEERRRARAEVGLPAEAFVVGMLAQLRPRKGPEHLIRAAREIVDKHPEALFVFVGDAEFVEKRNYLADLKRLACQCGVEEACRFVGFQSNTAQWVTAFDVMVLPSLFGEGLPLSLLEGMAHGLPIVTTDTEGNRCCVEDGRTGFLVPAADAGALAARLNELADSEPLRSEQGLAGFARARERFSIEAMLRGYEEVYEDLVEDRRSRRSAG
jgi:glycosyltransferase involved in cell wall biosynthesis